MEFSAAAEAETLKDLHMLIAMYGWKKLTTLMLLESSEPHRLVAAAIFIPDGATDRGGNTVDVGEAEEKEACKDEEQGVDDLDERMEVREVREDAELRGSLRNRRYRGIVDLCE